MHFPFDNWDTPDIEEHVSPMLKLYRCNTNKKYDLYPRFVSKNEKYVHIYNDVQLVGYSTF